MYLTNNSGYLSDLATWKQLGSKKSFFSKTQVRYYSFSSSDIFVRPLFQQNLAKNVLKTHLPHYYVGGPSGRNSVQKTKNSVLQIKNSVLQTKNSVIAAVTGILMAQTTLWLKKCLGINSGPILVLPSNLGRH